VWGPLIGAFIMIPLSEFSRAWLGGSGSAIDLIIYGFLIMLISAAKPSGLMGFITDLIHSAGKKTTQSATSTASGK
jgi:branched-chain amino acid transport system permease protein